MDILLENNQHMVHLPVQSDFHIKAMSIPTNTLPISAPAPYNCTRGAACPVSTGAGGIDDCALKDAEAVLSPEEVRVDTFSLVLDISDGLDSRKDVASVALSVVSIGGRKLVVLDAP